MLTSNHKKTKVRASKKRSKIPAKSVFSNPWCLLGYGFGVGLIPFAPGTFGTLLAIPLFLAMSDLSAEYYALMTLGLFAIGVHACSVSERIAQMQDDSGIVWDEVIGFLVTMAISPASMSSIALGFIYFRFFDIIKPWPIRILDRKVHGGLGIMIDDVLAGLFAAAALRITTQFLHLPETALF